MRAEIDALGLDPNDAHRTIASITKQLDYYESAREMQLAGIPLDIEQQDTVALLEQLLSQLEQLGLGPADTLVSRTRSLLADRLYELIQQIELERDYWGKGTLVAPGPADPSVEHDTSLEARIQRSAEDHERHTYRFLIEHESNTARYAERAVSQYRLLHEAATNMDDAASASAFRNRSDELGGYLK